MSGQRRGRWILSWLLALSVAGCASRVLEYDKEKELQKNEEYDKKIQVKSLPPPEIVVTPGPGGVQPIPAKDKKKRAKAKAEKPVTTAKGPRQPSLEDSEGFVGRRPVVDPFRVGEKVTLGLTYFNMTAGYMDLEVLPFVEVNGEKSYAFRVSARSNSFFSHFYSVDDVAMTYLSYETLVPYTFTIAVKESKQLADIRCIFDWKNLKGNYWEKKVTKEKGEISRTKEWEIKPYSQNVISAIYYLRTFTLRPGKKLAFRVGDDGQNLVFTGEVVRQEELETDLGVFKTVVVKPKIEVDGVFKPVGDILVWLTDDDRKLPVRIESKIRIGTIVGKLRGLEKGAASATP